MDCDKIYLGDAYELIKQIPDKSVDLIVTDPPYELNFMGKGWDRSGVAFDKAAREHNVSKTEVVRLAIDSGLSVKGRGRQK